MSKKKQGKRKQGLKLSPIHPQCRDDVWFYEEKNGLAVYVQQPNGVAHFVISYRSIEAYMRRRSTDQ